MAKHESSVRCCVGLRVRKDLRQKYIMALHIVAVFIVRKVLVFAKDFIWENIALIDWGQVQFHRVLLFLPRESSGK